jgi:hypothetical protein
MSSPVSAPTKAAAQKNSSWTNTNATNNIGNATATTATTTATDGGKQKGTRKVTSTSYRPPASRSYPRGVGLDFRKLAGISLINYIDHHGAVTLTAFLRMVFLNRNVNDNKLWLKILSFFVIIIS